MKAAIAIDDVCKARLENGRAGLVVVSPALGFVERMLAEQDPDALMILAANALIMDPACIEAHLALAGFARDQDTRLRHLKIAVKAGFHLWNPVAERTGNQVTCAEHPGMVPYARAVSEFGEALLDNGNVSAAQFCFQNAAAMNSPDPQAGVHADAAGNLSGYAS